MAFVLLPCDLPCWTKIEKLLQPLQEQGAPPADLPEQFTAALYAVHSLCNIGIDPGGLDSVPEDYFKAVKDFLEGDKKEADVLRRALPQLVRSALDMGRLKPPEGLSYSLQQQSDALLLSRGMAASLLAHTFLSTLPRRSIMTHPTLCNPTMAPVLNQVHSEDERVKVRAVLQYFALLGATPVNLEGRVLLHRRVMGSENFLRLRKWRDSPRRLCRLQVTGESLTRIPSRPCLLACCCTAHPALAALLPHSIQDARGLEGHPELLVTGLLSEKFEDNEVLQVRGLLSPSPPQASSTNDIIYGLVDADDYSDNWILQYESINLLRELNKCFLTFSPPMKLEEEKSIPVVPAGRVIRRALVSGVSSVSAPRSIDLGGGSPSSPADFGVKSTKVAATEKNGGATDGVFQYPPTGTEDATDAAKDGGKNGVAEKGVEKKEGTELEPEGKKKEIKEPPQTVTVKEEGNTSKIKGSSELDKRKMPKILEMFLPKKILAPNQKKKSVSSDAAKTDQASSGVGSPGTTSVDKISGSAKAGDSGESGFQEPAEVDTQNFETAQNTLRKNKKGGKLPGSGANEEGSKTKGANAGDKSQDGGMEIKGDGGTSDLLNRVLTAIQKLEAEQTIMLKNVPPHEIAPEELIPKTDDLNPKSISRVKSKPPLPEGTGRKLPQVPKRKGRPLASLMGKDEDGSKEAADAKKKQLSLYQSCSEEAAPHEEEFFSASESLDLTSEGQSKPRRKGGRRERLSKYRRKSSFAERLKEAMERGGSSDRASPYSEQSAQPRSLPRNDSGGFVLSSTEEPEEPPSQSKCPQEEGNRKKGSSRKMERRSDTVFELPGRSDEQTADGSGSGSGGGRWSTESVEGGSQRGVRQDDEAEGNAVEDEEADEGSGSSRYSFSSDYTSELEEVYDHLEEVLQQLEGATPGPRTAAIAQLAHSLLKRAFSESSKGLEMGPDGGGGSEDGPRGEARPRSMSCCEGSPVLQEEIPETEGVTVLTESWGCDELRGDHQLKALVQWAAASMAEAEAVVYCTHGHDSLAKLCVLSRLLEDRQWTVGQLTEAILRYCHGRLARWRSYKSKVSQQDPSPEELGGTPLFDRLLAPSDARQGQGGGS